MAIIEMKRLRLIGLRPDRERLLRMFQTLGCVEISEPAIDLTAPEWETLTRPEDGGLARAKEQSTLLNSALAVLDQYAPAGDGRFARRPELREAELFDDGAYTQGLETAGAVTAGERTLAAFAAERGRLTGQKASLEPWLPLDVPLDLKGDGAVSYLFGAVPAQTDLAEAENAVAQATGLAELIPAGSDRERQYFLLVCHAAVEADCAEAIRPFGFSQMGAWDWVGTAADNMRRIDNRLAELDKDIEKGKARIASFAPQRELLRRCADRAAQEIARERARDRLLDTEAVFLLEGWVPAESETALAQTLDGFTCAWETEAPAEADYPQVPVKLKNNIFSRSMNVVTEMYSLPVYGGVDPNPLMAPFFILFFGIMMADMAYGVIMAAVSLFVLRKLSPQGGTRSFMELVFWCGVSTFVLGAMIGSFFGDFIPQLARLINPDSTLALPALFTPLDDTVAIMLGSLMLGLIQIVTGMAVSVIGKIRAGNFPDALFDEITWWIILGGIALAVFGVGTVAGVPVVLVIGCLMLAFGGTRKARGLGKAFALVGLVYNGVTGFFSDILSYVRLMAIMLASSVVAQVFNTLGSVFGNVVMFVIVSMIGNALNLALGLLGCYVHDLRLQCLEFFGRFYKEGGRPYQPLSIRTKYVDVIKEEQ